jgi:hypothetical protein
MDNRGQPVNTFSLRSELLMTVNILLVAVWSPTGRAFFPGLPRRERPLA